MDCVLLRTWTLVSSFFFEFSFFFNCFEKEYQTHTHTHTPHTAYKTQGNVNEQFQEQCCHSVEYLRLQPPFHILFFLHFHTKAQKKIKYFCYLISKIVLKKHNVQKTGAVSLNPEIVETCLISSISDGLNIAPMLWL